MLKIKLFEIYCRETCSFYQLAFLAFSKVQMHVTKKPEKGCSFFPYECSLNMKIVFTNTHKFL